MYSVYQHWDRLKVCVVGKSYPPEFYNFIDNKRARNVMERIAIETEEDYQKLVALLESFKVEVLRPNLVKNNHSIKSLADFRNPPMTPRDYTAMIGNDLYFDKKEYLEYLHLIKYVKNKKNTIKNNLEINSACTIRCGKDLYFGPQKIDKKIDKKFIESVKLEFTDYRCHFIDCEGHLDGNFCVVVPGLIVSTSEFKNLENYFPNWEILYIPNQDWEKIKEWQHLKKKNKGKWWVSGEELNDDFTDFVETWLNKWVGYVEESVFDINMLVVDKKNVIVTSYNKILFDTLKKYNITPHILNFRHRFFWDGGLHCITSDLDREGVMEDYFPERG